MHPPASRILTVLELLQSHAQMSGRELADRLEVDRRTVRRYLTQLQDLGIPVEAERGRYGAYRLLPGYKLPPLMFSNDEAIALTLGLLVARQIKLEGANLAIEGALSKILRVMPPSLRNQAHAIQNTLVMEELFSDSPQVAQKVVAALSGAIEQQRQIQLRYRAYDGTDSERTFDPYGLVVRNGHWYSTGYCHLRQDLRTFRLDRIVNTQVLESSFTRPADFDPLASIERSLAQVPRQHRVNIRFSATVEEIQPRLPVTLGVLTTTDDGVVLQGYVESVRWLALLLLELDSPMTICEPIQLRDEFQHMRQQIEQILSDPIT
ncbi:MAG TPA: helix-turn-helix transcriptional regulator [Elainellaceae cyanobacterium]